MQYVSGADVSKGCIFCDHLQGSDEAQAGILYRGPRTFVLLNAFPYNSGHVMVAPYRHVGELPALEVAERAELVEVTSITVEVLTEAMEPHGFNVGMNLGRAAGAGIPSHLHVHVVPRWGGDTNFMTTVGEAKVLPEILADTDRKLRPLFGRRAGSSP